MIPAYRITQSRFVSSAFSGDGAREHGGRWNSPGTRMVYASGSLSLATMELLVHVEDISVVLNHYIVIPIEFGRSLVQIIDRKSLPNEWNSPVVHPDTQRLGDKWIRDESSAVLRVPSAVIDREHNYLLNPEHPDFRAISIGEAFPLKVDPRLRARLK